MSTQPPTESPLIRPASDRARDYKYRLAQSLIFGLPVLALQFLGPKLGGSESSKWVGLFQALLAGWVIYIAALPIIIESALENMLRPLHHRPRRYGTLVILLVLILYVIGIATWVLVLLRRSPTLPASFAIAVSVVILWCGYQWLRLSRRAAA